MICYTSCCINNRTTKDIQNHIKTTLSQCLGCISKKCPTSKGCHILKVFKTRVGLTATKKIGHAVQRNRARRVMKAAIDEHLDQNIGGYDLVFVARGMTPRLKSWQLSEVVARLFAQAGLPDKAKQPGAKPPATVPPADRAAKQ